MFSTDNQRYQVWQPQPGPQTAAYNSAADAIGYGGAAGGGKTDLAIGLAGTAHHRSIIFRRVFPSLRGIISRSKEVFTTPGDSYNGSDHIWTLASKKQVELGSMQYEDDKKKYQGQPHDLYVFDEATEFAESQVTFVMSWNRSTHIDERTGKPQHCRVLLTFNPPFDDSGDWVTRMFAPWLDDKHIRPAKDGELRWFAVIDDVEREVNEADLLWFVGKEAVADGEPFQRDGQWQIPMRGLLKDGEPIYAKSRTFFRALLKDNPILEATGYGATIDATPEPIRSLLKGKFNVGKVIDPWQTIPTVLIQAAQARWSQMERPAVALRCVGDDVAHGGADNTVLAPLYGTYFDELEVYPGSATPKGEDNAIYAKALAGMNTLVAVDSIGYGSSATDVMQSWGMQVIGVNFGAACDFTDKSGKFRFANVRAAAYWLFREALELDSGENIALPEDRELLIDLAAPKYRIVSGRITIEPKEDIKKRIGRSPDKGDAVVLAWWGVVMGNIRVAFASNTPNDVPTIDGLPVELQPELWDLNIGGWN